MGSERPSGTCAFLPVDAAERLGCADDMAAVMLRDFADRLGADGAVLRTEGSAKSALFETWTGGFSNVHRSQQDSIPNHCSIIPAGLESAIDPSDVQVFDVPFCVGERTSWVASAFFRSSASFSRQEVERAAGKATAALSAFFTTWRRLKVDRARLCGLEAALDLTDAGIVVVDADGRILFANTEAERLLDSGEGVRRSDDSVTATCIDDAIRMRIAIQHCANGIAVAPGRARADDLAMLMLERPGKRRPLIVSICPAVHRSISASPGSVLLYLLDPEADLRPMLEPVCRMYHLSGVETALAIDIAMGVKVEDAAVRMGIQLQTARSYLKQIFVKTVTKRQADLLRLLLVSIVHVSTRPVAASRKRVRRRVSIFEAGEQRGLMFASSPSNDGSRSTSIEGYDPASTGALLTSR